MKRRIILLILSLIIVCTFADSTNNVKFMGISMEAPFSEFVSELSKKCEIVGVKGPMAIFKGNFAGLNNCSIMVASMDGSTLVMVMSQEYSSWKQLKNDFITIANAYENKYGTPTTKNLTFDGNYYDGGGDEMLAVKKDMCDYKMMYLIDNKLLVTIFISKDSQINFAYALVEGEKEPTQIEVNSDDI